MTLAMDGLRRTTNVQPPAGVAILPLARPKPLLNAEQPASNVRYVTGLDGIRRAAPAPTPREVIAKMTVVEIADDHEQSTPQVAAAVARPWQKRPAIAFSLVAAALVAAGGAAMVVNATRATSVSAASDGKTAVEQPAAEKPAPAVVAAAATANQRQAELQQLLNQFTASQKDGHFNIVVKDLKSGMTASIDPDASYRSASLYKLFVAQQIYRMIDTGKLTYGQAAGGGSGNNVVGCLSYMITISDNTCGVALGSILNWGAQNAALANAGYTGTSLTTPQQTNAHDVALLFERLYEGTLNSPNANDAFMGLLKNQRVNNRLPVGLPAGTVIAHKTGDLDDVVHDAGIVYGPKTDYLVVAMSGGWNAPANAPGQFAALSQQLWNFFEQ